VQIFGCKKASSLLSAMLIIEGLDGGRIRLERVGNNLAEVEG
jgi:hypothetical protein